MCLDKPLNFSAPLFLSASCSSEKRGVWYFLPPQPPHSVSSSLRLFPCVSWIHWQHPSVTPVATFPSLHFILMRLGPVLLCISRNLAFLRSVFHRYLVTLGIKSSLVTAPFQTRKSSVYVSFHTSCPFSLCPGIGTRQAGPFIFVPSARVVLVLSLVPPLPLQALAKLPCLNQMPLVPASLTQRCFPSSAYTFHLHILVSFEFVLYLGSYWEKVCRAHANIPGAQ